jgi:O-antigen/teichoic acid export membrane protein
MTASRTSKVFALSLGKGLTTVVALVSGMVMARILSQAELATYRQTLLAYQVAVPLLSLGVAQGIYYFLPPEKFRVRGVVVDALVLMLTMGLLYAVFIALGGNHLLAKRFSNPAIVNTLAYIVPLPLVMLPAGLLSSVMVVQNQVNKLTVYNVLTNLLLAAGIIGACLVWKTPESMVLTKVGVSVVIGIVAIVLMLQATPRDDWRPRWSHMKTMVGYSIPLVLAGALGSISLQLDKLIVSSMCTPEEFAVYSTGATEIPLIGIITGSISSVMLVEFRRAFAAGEMPEALRLYREVPLKTTLFLFPAMVYLMLAAKPFMILLFSEKYAASSTAFMLYLLLIPYRTFLLGGMAAVGKSRIVLRNSAISLLLNLVLSILLVKRLGYLGAIIATVVAMGAWNIPILFREMSRSLHTSLADIYPWKTAGLTLLLALAAAIPAAAAIGLLRDRLAIVQIGVSGPIFAAVYLGILGKFRPDARQDLVMWCRRLRAKAGGAA